MILYCAGIDWGTPKSTHWITLSPEDLLVSESRNSKSSGGGDSWIGGYGEGPATELTTDPVQHFVFADWGHNVFAKIQSTHPDLHRLQIEADYFDYASFILSYDNLLFRGLRSGVDKTSFVNDNIRIYSEDGLITCYIKVSYTTLIGRAMSMRFYWLPSKQHISITYARSFPTESSTIVRYTVNILN